MTVDYRLRVEGAKLSYVGTCMGCGFMIPGMVNDAVRRFGGEWRCPCGVARISCRGQGERLELPWWAVLGKIVEFAIMRAGFRRPEENT